MARNDLEARAERALKFFGDPAFRAAYDAARQEIISALEQVVLDGSQERANQVLELQRQLRLITRIRQHGLSPVRAVDIKQNSDNRRKAPRA